MNSPRTQLIILPGHLAFIVLLVLGMSTGVSSRNCHSVAFALTTSLRKVKGRARGDAVASTFITAFASLGDDGGAEEYDEDDDDDEDIKPYGSRSLAWTKRYRKLNPYVKVRRRVLKFGHRSKEDWDECVASGLQGQYVPARPDEMYAPEWVSWEEFLGLMRPYHETRNIAVNVLGLKSLDDYILFVHQNPKRAEGLRIPLRPDKVYKEEWIDSDHFFQK